MPGAEALAKTGIEAMVLSYKDGLALIIGTSGMVGLGIMVYRAPNGSWTPTR
ncbi:aromatic amino acid lyase [Streptomyces caniferus]|uniref:aromatic amino acid lyase n=1 Tax=Streptomyces caniferus TaxID=285557 RepID=UPI00371A450E